MATLAPQSCKCRASPPPIAAVVARADQHQESPSFFSAPEPSPLVCRATASPAFSMSTLGRQAHLGGPLLDGSHLLDGTVDLQSGCSWELRCSPSCRRRPSAATCPLPSRCSRMLAGQVRGLKARWGPGFAFTFRCFLIILGYLFLFASPSFPDNRRKGDGVMQNYSTDHIRNVVLLSHCGAGKTSLSEAMLFTSGAIPRLGRVDDGSSTSDLTRMRSSARSASTCRCFR